MKKLLLFSFLLTAATTAMAQDDDMYFGKAEMQTKSVPPAHVSYHNGSQRDVDEYNRRPGKYYDDVAVELGLSVVTRKTDNNWCCIAFK